MSGDHKRKNFRSKKQRTWEKNYFLVQYDEGSPRFDVREEDDLVGVDGKVAEFEAEDRVMVTYENGFDYPATIVEIKASQKELKQTMKEREIQRKRRLRIGDKVCVGQQSKKAKQILDEVHQSSDVAVMPKDTASTSKQKTRDLEAKSKELLSCKRQIQKMEQRVKQLQEESCDDDDMSESNFSDDDERHALAGQDELLCSIRDTHMHKCCHHHTCCDVDKEVKRLKLQLSEYEVSPESKGSGEEKIKPRPGIMDSSIAIKNKMYEVVDGSGVYWTAANKDLVLSCTSSATQLTSSMIDIFFSKEKLADSNLKGGGKNNHTALDATIISAIRAFVLKRYEGVPLSIINNTISNKCTSARRAIQNK